jgi:hypothetical protein
VAGLRDGVPQRAARQVVERLKEGGSGDKDSSIVCVRSPRRPRARLAGLACVPLMATASLVLVETWIHWLDLALKLPSETPECVRIEEFMKRARL